MAALDSSAADFMYKKLYRGGLDKDFLLRSKQLLLWMSHEEDFTTEKGIEIPVKHKNQQGVGSTNANAATVATPSGGKSFTVPQRHVVAYGQIDGIVVRNAMAGGGEAHFADEMESEVDSCTESLGSDLNRSGYGANDGVRSFLSATAAVNTAFGYFANAEEAQLYEIGMRIQFVNPAGGALRVGGTGYVTITAIDTTSAAPSFSFAGGNLNALVTDIVAGDGIVRWSMNTKDLDGIRGWCPNTVASSGDSFLGVDRYAYRTRLAGLYLNYASMPVRSALIKAVATAKGHVGKLFQDKSPWFINPKNFGQLRMATEAQRVIQGEQATSYGIGIEKFDIDGHTFIQDEHAPVDEVIMVGKGALTRGSCGDQPKIDNQDGRRFDFNRSTGMLDFALAHDGNTYSRKPWNLLRVAISAQAA